MQFFENGIVDIFLGIIFARSSSVISSCLRAHFFTPTFHFCFVKLLLDCLWIDIEENGHISDEKAEASTSWSRQFRYVGSTEIKLLCFSSKCILFELIDLHITHWATRSVFTRVVQYVSHCMNWFCRNYIMNKAFCFCYFIRPMRFLPRSVLRYLFPLHLAIFILCTSVFLAAHTPIPLCPYLSFSI